MCWFVSMAVLHFWVVSASWRLRTMSTVAWLFVAELAHCCHCHPKGVEASFCIFCQLQTLWLGPRSPESQDMCVYARALHFCDHF